jgi:hypothetical protein
VSPIVAAVGTPAKKLLVDFEVTSTALKLSFAVVLDVIHHCAGYVRATERALIDAQCRAFHQVETTLLKAELTFAELADESDLIKHIDEISVQLLWLEDFLAVCAVGAGLKPLFNTLSVKYLLALNALDSVLGDVEAYLADERIYELSLTFKRVYFAKLVSSSLCNHEIDDLSFNLRNELQGLLCGVVIEPRILL